MGDLDLLCFEGTSSALKFDDWIMTQHDPAGTIEMKPPEVCSYTQHLRYYMYINIFNFL